MRQFVVGTGGKSLYPFGRYEPNSELRKSEAYGVIKFTLRSEDYDWEFASVRGSSFGDSGSGDCH